MAFLEALDTSVGAPHLAGKPYAEGLAQLDLDRHLFW